MESEFTLYCLIYLLIKWIRKISATVSPRYNSLIKVQLVLIVTEVGMSVCAINSRCLSVLTKHTVYVRRLICFHLLKLSSSCTLFVQPITQSSSWRSINNSKNNIKMSYYRPVGVIGHQMSVTQDVRWRSFTPSCFWVNAIIPVVTNTLLIRSWCFGFACSCTVWKDGKEAWQPDVQKINWSYCREHALMRNFTAAAKPI